MKKEEFQEMIGQIITDREYEIIETVYMYHPSFDPENGGDIRELVRLSDAFGMTIFCDMYPRAMKYKELEDQLHHAQAEVDQLKEEMARNRATMGLDYSRMLDKLATPEKQGELESTPQQQQSDTNGLQRVEITTKKDISSMFTQVAIDGHVIPYVRGYQLEHIAGKPPVLSLDLNCLDLYIDEPMALRHKGLDKDIEVRVKREESVTSATDSSSSE